MTEENEPLNGVLFSFEEWDICKVNMDFDLMNCLQVMHKKCKDQSHTYDNWCGDVCLIKYNGYRCRICYTEIPNEIKLIAYLLGK